MVGSAVRFVRSLAAPVPLIVFSIVAIASVVAFVLAGNVASEQERRLLTERADEAAVVVNSGIATVDASLSTLAAVGDSEHDDGALFDALAAGRVAGRTTAVGLATATDAGFTITNATGESTQSAASLDPAFAAVLQRAASLDEPALVTDVIGEGADRRTVFARTAGGPTIAFQESIASDEPTALGLNEAFSELRAALYAAPDTDLGRVVLTTDDQPPVAGIAGVTTRPIRVGADTWQLAVGPRAPLVGPVSAAMPWLVLVSGLVAALLAAITAASLWRRREYAERVAAERTRSLASTLNQLAQTRAFLTDVLTYGPTVVVVTAMPERRVTYVSPNLERELGIDPAHLTDELPLAQRVHPDDLPGARAVLSAVADGSLDTGSAEYRIADDSGTYRWVSATIVPANVASGPGDAQAAATQTLILTYLVDVDQRRHAEEDLRAATQAAEAANLSKSQFLSRMSHELRTPLNAIIGFGQILELDDLTDVQRDSVDHVLKGGRHLLTLVNEVLDISRVEAGELTLSPEAVAAREVVEDAVSLIRPLARQRGISIHVDTSACTCHVFADRQRLKQVLLNLLSNAVKYNRVQGSILVRCRQDPTQLQIEVTDTGIGIAADRFDRLFMPFERLGAEQTVEEGTGIGLALSRKLMEAMGGTLDATSTLGQGTTFRVNLPVVEAPIERVERLGALPELEPEPRDSDHRAVILHVEDNASNITLVERIVAARPQVRVVAAKQGSLAVDLARQHRPALILLDLHLPDIDGHEVLRQLRDDPRTMSIPVVVVSADATVGQVQRILSAGAAAYLTKPIEVRGLLKVVDDAVAASARAEDHV